MTDTAREESENGKFSQWIFVKNWITDYLKTTDLDIDGNKYLSVNVKTITEEDPDAATKNNGYYTFSYDGDSRLQYINLTFNATTWRKTLYYTSGRLSWITVWEKQ